jgi:hypothetical protein
MQSWNIEVIVMLTINKLIPKMSPNSKDLKGWMEK